MLDVLIDVLLAGLLAVAIMTVGIIGVRVLILTAIELQRLPPDYWD